MEPICTNSSHTMAGPVDTNAGDSIVEVLMVLDSTKSVSYTHTSTGKVTTTLPTGKRPRQPSMHSLPTDGTGTSYWSTNAVFEAWFGGEVIEAGTSTDIV